MFLSIPVKPFSVNQMYTRDLRFRSQAGTQWLANVFSFLSTKQSQSELDKIRNTFDHTKHAFEIDLTFVYPKDVLFTKEGKISSKAQDLSNCEKLIIDAIFDEKFKEKGYPYGCNNLGINDKHIISLCSRKQIGPEHEIQIRLKIVDLPNSDIDCKP